MTNLLSTSKERVYFKDLMSRFLFVSQGWIEAYTPGRTAEELTGKTDFDVFTKDHASAAFADEQEIIHTGEPLVGQVERETYSGRPDAWVSTTKMPLRDDRGEIIGTFGITRDITPQITAEHALARQAGELSAQNERLRELDRLKDEFVALVSHELRTPLTSIIGYIQLLRDERASGLDTDHFAEVIERNAERLLRLVGDLLFLSQIQSGQLALELRDTDLAGLAVQAVDDARPEAQRKHVDLDLSAAAVPRLAVDPTRIAQLLGNLISNAVKFTPEGGKVGVTLAVEDGEAVLSVSDTGIGIRPADRERIFERFFRTEAATRRVIPGSGLGLTISQAIVEAHGGIITVHSDEEHGSTFTVRLPLAPQRPALGAGRRRLPCRPVQRRRVQHRRGQVARSGLASGQPPAASLARTRATSDSSGFSWVTAPMDRRIASAESGSLSWASVSAISVSVSGMVDGNRLRLLSRAARRPGPRAR
jgi:PAS domain S-box-containing protein